MNSNGSIALWLSIVAIAAACVVVPTRPSASIAPAAQDDAAVPAPESPAPMLAAAPDRFGASTRRTEERDDEAAASEAPQRSEAELERARAAAEEDSLARQHSAAIRIATERDPVSKRIRDEVERLMRIEDDLALRDAGLADAEDRQARDRVAPHPPEASESSPPAVPLPDRALADLQAWLREPMDLSGLDDFDGAVAQARRQIEWQRRRAARAYEFEVARLRPDSLREYARGRSSRQPLETWDDVGRREAAAVEWRRRMDAWIAVDGGAADDARELAELVRTIPSRVWAPLEVRPHRHCTAEESD